MTTKDVLLTVGEEEFVSTAALSEDPGAYPLFLNAPPQSPIAASEEFVAVTLAHEDPPPFILLVDEQKFVVSIESQDFTTVAVVDDTVIAPPTVWPSAVAWQPTPSEDFAGSMPFDESTITIPPPSLPNILAPFASTEGFASPKLDEDAGFVFVAAPEISSPLAANFNEDFAGVLAVDEDTVPTLIGFSVCATFVFNVGEEFPLPPIPPVPPGPAPLPPLPPIHSRGLATGSGPLATPTTFGLFPIRRNVVRARSRAARLK